MTRRRLSWGGNGRVASGAGPVVGLSLLSMIQACITASFFFFQAEDGIRYLTVTGVQTCALPICSRRDAASRSPRLRLAEAPERERGRRGVAFATAWRVDAVSPSRARERGRARDRDRKSVV